MKKSILIIILSGLSFFVQAQDDDPAKRAEKIQALKIAFITQKLELNADEAQKFWPVYGNYEREINQVVFLQRGNGDRVEADERLLNIRKRYRPEFVKVIGQSRMNQLFNAEREFRGVLMRHIKNKPSHPSNRKRK